MKKTSLKVKPFPYRLTYGAIKKGAVFGILIEEYHNQLLVKQSTFFNLTKDPNEMAELIQYFENNQVFSTHAKEVLEDMGYLNCVAGPTATY